MEKVLITTENYYPINEAFRELNFGENFSNSVNTDYVNRMRWYGEFGSCSAKEACMPNFSS